MPAQLFRQEKAAPYCMQNLHSYRENALDARGRICGCLRVLIL